MKLVNTETGVNRDLKSLADHYSGAVIMFVQQLADSTCVPVYAKVWFGNIETESEKIKGFPIGVHRLPENDRREETTNAWKLEK